jgi:hypothetical protein
MSTQYAVPHHEFLDPRVTELLDHQFVTGLPLPLPIAAILSWEDAGAIVDLDTGDIFASEQAWLDHLVATTDEVAPICPYCTTTMDADIDGDWVCADCLHVQRAGGI